MVAPATPYDHDEFGRVRVQCVDDGTVYFNAVGETIHGTGLPLAGRQPVADFEDATEPAPQGVSVPTEAIRADEPSL